MKRFLPLSCVLVGLTAVSFASEKADTSAVKIYVEQLEAAPTTQEQMCKALMSSHRSCLQNGIGGLTIMPKNKASMLVKPVASVKAFLASNGQVKVLDGFDLTTTGETKWQFKKETPITYAEKSTDGISVTENVRSNPIGFKLSIERTGRSEVYLKLEESIDTEWKTFPVVLPMKNGQTIDAEQKLPLIETVETSGNIDFHDGDTIILNGVKGASVMHYFILTFQSPFEAKSVM